MHRLNARSCGGPVPETVEARHRRAMTVPQALRNHFNPKSKCRLEGAAFLSSSCQNMSKFCFVAQLLDRYFGITAHAPGRNDSGHTVLSTDVCGHTAWLA
jgi:hypothetical protein